VDASPDPPAAIWPSLWAGVFVLMGLAGVAITQPVLDLMGRNPEFFVAGSYTTSQIIWFGVIVALVPSTVMVVVYVLSRLAHPRLGWWVLLLLVAGLGAVFGNVLVRGLGFDSALLALAAAVVGAAVAVLLVRGRAGRLLLEYLAVANVLFLVAFLFMSPVSALMSAESVDGAVGAVTVPVPPGPVVVIVFDELPVSTLMKDDGTINEERYPAFARLAADATWFRNASSPHNRTERAVPALVTGNIQRDRTMPTFSALPRNLLALMGTSVPVERYEALTDLCPRETCDERGGKPLRTALGDSLVVYGHRVLPPVLREDLAPIDDAWGDFGGGMRGVRTPPPTADPGTSTQDPFATENPLARWHGSDLAERSPLAQAARLAEQGKQIDGEPALHFIHVVLPHAPWFATPWGTTLMPPMPEWEDDVGGGDDAAWSNLIRYQRHSLQTGTADVALGQVIDHLQDTGIWEDATVLVTADHGTSTLLPDVARVATENNAEEVFRVPLFLKAAGQTEGTVVDDVAMTIDVLPTLMQVLDIETDWEMQGHSLIDGSEPTVEPEVRTDLAGLFTVVDRHAADFPNGWDWTALAAVGAHGPLVGTPLAELEVGDPSRLRWTARNEATFGELPNDLGEMPQIVVGEVEGSAGEPPPLVIVANGTVAGVTGGYDPKGSAWTFSSTLGPYLVEGANDIQAFEVTQVDGRPVLHRLD
jgi:hypothetical protein